MPTTSPRPSLRRLAGALTAVVLAAAGLGAPLSAPMRPVAAKGLPAEDRAELLAGVTVIDSSPGSVPGPVLAYGPAFPVVVGAEGDLRLPVVAASRWQRGRVVAYGHGGFLDPATLDRADTQSGRFMLNVIRWAGGGEVAPERLRVGVAGMDGYRGWLAARGIPADALAGDWTANLGRYDVLVWGAWRQGQAERDAIAAFVKGGGGLVAESLAWGWMQLNPGVDIRRHAGNQLLAPAGLLWADGYFDRTATNGFAAPATPPAMTQGSDALAALETRRAQMPPAEIGQAVHTLTRAIVTLPRDDGTLLPKLRAMVAGLGPIVPTEARPIRLVEEPLERIGLTLQVEDLHFTPADRIEAHPAGSDFPGAVGAEVPRVDRTLSIDARQSRWHSTGLFAAPGEHLTVEIAPGLVDDGLAIRISPFTDTLWHMESWTRVPAIASRFVLTSTTTVVASAFGGPVYVDVPDDGGPGTAPLDPIVVTVRGAVEAPLFRLGETDVAAWRADIRHRPAPWAEIVSAKIGITVPSEVVRDLDDPGALMRYWDDVADAQADLAAIPRDRPWAERFVADRQIGYGYMHAGYPMMTFLDVRDLVVDAGRLRREGSWGHFHELGHMHQEPEWTFEGTGEVTVNLFTLYTYDRVNDQRPGGSNAGHLERFTPAAIRKRWEDFDAAGRRFSEWKSDPFLALAMYAQLAQAFGWESYARVFAEYRRLPDAQRPRDDDARRDQWLTRMSRTVERNLCPFFGLWGVPVSRAACDSLADLPEWDPWTEVQATPTPTVRPSPTIAVTETPTWTPTPSPTVTPMPTQAPGGRVYLPVVEASFSAN